MDVTDKLAGTGINNNKIIGMFGVMRVVEIRIDD